MKKNKPITIGILLIIGITLQRIIIKSIEINKNKIDKNNNIVLVEKVVTDDNNDTQNTVLEDKDRIEGEKEIRENKDSKEEQKSIIVLNKAEVNTTYEDSIGIEDEDTYDLNSINTFNNIPKTMEGEWKVEKLCAKSKINCHSDEDIENIIGVKIVYSNDLAIINGHKYNNPEYSTDYLDTYYFNDNLKEELNIVKDKIKVVTVKTSNSQFIYGLGGHVIIIKKQPYLYDGGEFFKLVKS